MARSFDSLGSSRFPLLPAAAIQSAADYDPGLASIIGLLSAAIEANIGAAWRAEVGRLHAESLFADSAGPVGSVLTVIPNPQSLTQVKRTWPLLAVYREGKGARDLLTLSYPAVTQSWSVDWIIGPLGPDMQRKLGHFWVQVRNTILVAIEQGYHPSYQNGACQFFGQFVSIIPTDHEGPAVAENLQGQHGEGYFGGSVTLESVERLTYQSKAAGDRFNSGAYLPPGDGYGDNATQVVVEVDYDNMRPPTVGIDDL